MKINKKIFSLFALVTFLSCIAPVTVFAEEYVLGKKYYKNFPGAGNKWVELYSVTEYDEKGNEIHWENSAGDEAWYEYDKNRNEIYSKNSDGYETWYEYDKNGNLIHMKDSDGYEDWYEYSYWPDGTIKRAWCFIKF